MKPTLKTKIILTGTAAIFLFVATNIILTYLLMIPFYVKMSSRQLKTVSNMILQQNPNDEEKFQDFIEQIEEDMNIKTTIVSEDGALLYTTVKNMENRNSLKPGTSPYVIFNNNLDALRNGEVIIKNRQLSENLSDTIRIYLLNKIGDNKYVILSRSYRSLENIRKSSILFDIMSGLLIMVIGFVIVRKLADYYVKPIKQITDVAEHIADMDFDRKVEITSNDELGKLSQSINRMSDHLQINVEKLKDDIEDRKKLMRNLSHEIKSPVAVIVGYADRIKALIETNPGKAVKYSDIITEESRNIDALVKVMLSFSKLEQSSFETQKDVFKAKTLFEDVKRQFFMETTSDTGEGNESPTFNYKEDYDPEDTIYGDLPLLLSAVNNLLRNVASHAHADTINIKVSGQQNNDYYEISVYNSGSNIPEDELSSIWEPFSKVDKVRSRGKNSYGLGLSIVREIVEKHEGYYRASNTGDGVEFLISVHNIKN